MRSAFAWTLALGLLALAAPATALPTAAPATALPTAAPATALPTAAPAIPYCDQQVQSNCWHETANGVCYLYLGGPGGACVLYGDVDPSRGYDNGGACQAQVHTNCSHPSAPSRCILYAGGPGGACVVW